MAPKTEMLSCGAAAKQDFQPPFRRQMHINTVTENSKMKGLFVLASWVPRPDVELNSAQSAFARTRFWEGERERARETEKTKKQKPKLIGVPEPESRHAKRNSNRLNLSTLHSPHSRLPTFHTSSTLSTESLSFLCLKPGGTVAAVNAAQGSL